MVISEIGKELTAIQDSANKLEQLSDYLLEASKAAVNEKRIPIVSTTKIELLSTSVSDIRDIIEQLDEELLKG